MKIEINHDRQTVDIVYKDDPPSKDLACRYHSRGYTVRVIKEGSWKADYVLDWF